MGRRGGGEGEGERSAESNPILSEARWIVCTQDQTLRRRLRAYGAIPLIYIHKSVVILEPLSEATQDRKTQTEITRRLPGAQDLYQSKDAAAAAGIIPVPHDKAARKKRKAPPEPNPLSCKRKKLSAAEQRQVEAEKQKKKTSKREKQRVKRCEAKSKLQTPPSPQIAS